MRLFEAGLLLLDTRGLGPLAQGTSAPRRIPLPIGDIYEPGEPALAGLVLVPGATPAGKDDRALVAFAQSLARVRFRVLAPEIPGLRRLRLGPEDIGPVAEAVRALGDRMRAGQPLGLLAVSYAAGPAAAALLEPGVSERVDFTVLIGGYHDIEAVLTFIGTGYWRDGPARPWRHRKPLTPGKWVFMLSNAERLESAQDRALLTEIARRRLRDREADTGDLEARLGDEGRTVLALLSNPDPDHVPALIAALPQAIRADLARLDPRRLPLGALKSRFVLIHGIGDRFIPESESRAFARALFPGQADLYLAGGLNHVTPEPLGILDGLTLLRAANRVLELRDRR